MGVWRLPHPGRLFLFVNFFTIKKFSEAVAGTCDGLVKCTIGVYTQIAQDLRPTPTKSHYTFNLRDVAKVFQGVLMVQPKEGKKF